MSKFLLFSGTSNLPLAKALAKKLKIRLGKIEITRFPDSESRVRITENIKGKTVYLLQSLSSPVDEHLFELCLMADSAKRLGAKKIIGIIPWLGYSKQDKEFRVGEAVSVEVIGEILSVVGLSKIIVFDLHSDRIKHYFKIPVIELTAKQILYQALITDRLIPGIQGIKSRGLNQSLVVISPDKGGKGRSELFAKDYHLSIIYPEKTRDLSTGKVTYEEITQDLSGKTAIIFDDIINRGATVIKAAEMLKKAKAKKVIVLVTHGVLAGGVSENLQKSKVDKIYSTDTIDILEEKQFLKLKIISIVEQICKFINITP